MSVLEWESPTLEYAEPIPPIPQVIPSFREAIPTDSQVIPAVGLGGSLFPPLGGNRESARAGRQAYRHRHKCGLYVLTGLDRHTCALEVTVDAYALNPLGEVEALRSGRRTYRFHHGRLHPRNRWNMPGNPADQGLVVVGQHACEPLPTGWLLPRPPEPKQSARLEEGIGF
jgi:hypothetical protein